MKRMLLAVLSALCFNATAQITINATTFPVVGDTFRYVLDLNPAGSTFITPPGGNQIWDFSNLKNDQNQQTVFSAPNTGNNAAAYPGADLLVKTQGGGETYYNVTTSKVEVMGFVGGAAVPFVPNALARFSPPLIDRRAPMNFGNTPPPQTSNITIPFSVNDLPAFFDSLLASIPGAQFIDSIRVKVTTNQADTVDAWGSLKIPGLNMPIPVLREKLVEKSTTTMEARLNIPFGGGWIDISTFLGGSGFEDFLGSDSSITFRFFSDMHKEELATVSANYTLDTIQSVRFKNIPVTTSAPEIGDAPGTASVQAFPNPAIDWVRFDCTNLTADEYTLKIFNIVGKVVWKETFQIAGKRSVTVDLEDFNKGTYLYSLVNRKGEIIGTKRLVVVKP